MTTALPFEVEAKPDDQFDVLPSGTYGVVVSAFEIKSTKNRDGSYAQIEFQITDQQYAGRKVWGRYTLQNPNAQAVQIGRRQLGELAHACGIQGAIRDLSQLAGRSCKLELVVRNSEQYGAQNDVKKALPSHGQASSATPPDTAPATSPTVSQQAAPAAPWEQ